MTSSYEGASPWLKGRVYDDGQWQKGGVYDGQWLCR